MQSNPRTSVNLLVILVRILVNLPVKLTRTNPIGLTLVGLPLPPSSQPSHQGIHRGPGNPMSVPGSHHILGLAQKAPWPPAGGNALWERQRRGIFPYSPRYALPGWPPKYSGTIRGSRYGFLPIFRTFLGDYSRYSSHSRVLFT